MPMSRASVGAGLSVLLGAHHQGEWRPTVLLLQGMRWK